MDERRKIVIPIGADPDSKSEQTFFDTQARKDARPVVLLSGASTTGPSVPGIRSRKWLLLVVILVAAVAAAGTAGAYVYMSRGRGQAGPQAAVQPVAGKTLSTLPWTHTPEDPVAEENANAAVDEKSEATEQAKDAKADNRDQKKSNKGRGKPGKKKDEKQPEDPIKRTQDELHRIREIFEGPP